MGVAAPSLLQNLFEEQKRYINYFFNEIDVGKVQEAVDLALACKGLLIFTGVGKSGIIAEKIVMTLISTGTRALFLPPLNFLHGDLGIASSEDLVIMLSKSGESETLLELVPYIRRKQCAILAVVSETASRLAKAADHLVYLPVEKELCPFDLAPTISTAVQLLFGDILSMALMREKGFSIEEYAINHPSGLIGKKITLRVEDLMKTGQDIPFCFGDSLLLNSLVDLSDKKCGCLIVVDEKQQLLGIFTDGDLRRALQKEGSFALEKKMSELMTTSPISVHPKDLAVDAVKKMQLSRYVMVAPVLNENKVVGVIRMHDIIYQGI